MYFTLIAQMKVILSLQFADKEIEAQRGLMKTLHSARGREPGFEIC